MKAHVIEHKDRGWEHITVRIQYPGKNTGWLGVGVHGNVWLIQGPTAMWICDIHDEGFTFADRKKIVEFAKPIIEGSLEQAYRDAAAGIKNPRCGYRVSVFDSDLGYSYYPKENRDA